MQVLHVFTLGAGLQYHPCSSQGEVLLICTNLPRPASSSSCSAVPGEPGAVHVRLQLRGAVENLPEGLGQRSGQCAQSCDDEGLQKKILQEAAKQGADLPDSQPDASFDDDDGALQAKKVAPAQSSRLQGKVAVPKPKRRKSAKKPEQEQVEGEGQEVVEATSLSKELRAVADELKTVPRCFANLSPARILAGEKLMRSVDAVPASTCSP